MQQRLGQSISLVVNGEAVATSARTLSDLLTGVLIAAPVYWLFTKLLGVNLPGLTGSGWI